MGIMVNTNLTNQRQVFVEEYVRSGDHLVKLKDLKWSNIDDATINVTVLCDIWH